MAGIESRLSRRYLLKSAGLVAAGLFLPPPFRVLAQDQETIPQPTKPIFLGSYPGKSEENEQKLATSVWQWYQQSAQSRGGILAKEAAELEKRVLGNLPVKKFGTTGVMRQALVAPVSWDEWPAANPDINMQLLSSIEPLEGKNFIVWNFLALKETPLPSSNDLGAMAINLIFPEQRADIVGRVIAATFNKEKDPTELKQRLSDPLSAQNQTIHTWTWRSVLGRVDAILQEQPDGWQMNPEFSALIAGYRERKDDPQSVDDYIKDHI